MEDKLVSRATRKMKEANRSKEQTRNPAFRPAPFRHGEEGEPLGGGETERNGSGTGKSDNSIRERVRERAVAFADDFKARGYAAFGDRRHSAVAICIELGHHAAYHRPYRCRRGYCDPRHRGRCPSKGRQRCPSRLFQCLLRFRKCLYPQTARH